MRALSSLAACPVAPLGAARCDRRRCAGVPVPSLLPTRHRRQAVVPQAGMTNPEWAPQPPSQQPAVGPLQAAPPTVRAARPDMDMSGPGWWGVAQAAMCTAGSLAVCLVTFKVGMVLSGCYVAMFTAVLALSGWLLHPSVKRIDSRSGAATQSVKNKVQGRKTNSCKKEGKWNGTFYTLAGSVHPDLWVGCMLLRSMRAPAAACP